jgi:putative transposase
MDHDGMMHNRRSIRLKGYDYSKSGAYFVTLCTRNRACLFGDIVEGEMRLNQFGRVVADEWGSSSVIRQAIASDLFVVMPNHVHGILVADTIPVGAIRESPLHEPPERMTMQQRRNMALSKWIGRFKMISAKRINQLRGTPGVPVWQRNYYEHIVRDEDDMGRIREYIAHNPARWAHDTEHPTRMVSDITIVDPIFPGDD